jgi:hypothetical protein
VALYLLEVKTIVCYHGVTTAIPTTPDLGYGKIRNMKKIKKKKSEVKKAEDKIEQLFKVFEERLNRGKDQDAKNSLG